MLAAGAGFTSAGFDSAGFVVGSGSVVDGIGVNPSPRYCALSPPDGLLEVNRRRKKPCRGSGSCIGKSSGSAATTTFVTAFVTGGATATTNVGLDGLAAGVVIIVGAGLTCTVSVGTGFTTGAGVVPVFTTGRGVTRTGGFSAGSARVLDARCCVVKLAILGFTSGGGAEVLITMAGAITVAATSLCSRPVTMVLTSS